MAYDPHGQYQPPPRMYQMPRARTFPPEQQHLDPRRNDASASDHHQFNEHEPFNGHGRPYQTHPGRPAYEPGQHSFDGYEQGARAGYGPGASAPLYAPNEPTQRQPWPQHAVADRPYGEYDRHARPGSRQNGAPQARRGDDRYRTEPDRGAAGRDPHGPRRDEAWVNGPSKPSLPLNGSSMPPAKAPSQQRPVQRRPASPELMSWDNPFPVFPGTKKKAPLGDKRSLEERMADTSIQQKSHAPDHLNGRSVHSSGSKSSQDSARSQRIPYGDREPPRAGANARAAQWDPAPPRAASRDGPGSYPRAASRDGPGPYSRASSRDGPGIYPRASSRDGPGPYPRATSRDGPGPYPMPASRDGPGSYPLAASRDGPGPYPPAASRAPPAPAWQPSRPPMPTQPPQTDARNHEWRGPHNGNPSDRYAVPGRDAPTAQYAPDRHARYETGNMTARPPARDDQWVAAGPGRQHNEYREQDGPWPPSAVPTSDRPPIPARAQSDIARHDQGQAHHASNHWPSQRAQHSNQQSVGELYDAYYEPRPTTHELPVEEQGSWHPPVEHGARQEEEGEEEMPNFDAVADHSSGHRRGMTIDQHVPQAKRMDRAPAPSIHPTNLQGSNEPAPATSGFADQAHRSRSQPDLRSQAGSGPGPGPIFEVAGDIPEMPSVPQMLPEMPGSDVPPDASRGVPSAGGRAGGYGGGYGGPRLQQQQTWPAQAPAPESHAYAQFDFDISSPSPAQYGPPHGFREPGHHGYGREERGYLDDRQASPRARPDLARPSLDSALARPPSPDGRPIHPDALSARPIHPDTLAAHPVPVRHGLAPTAAPPPQSKPPAPLRQYHHSSAPPGTQPTVNGAGVGAAAASSSAYGASSGVEPSGSRPPGRRPASSSTTTTASSSAPVTHAELDRLQAAAKAQPTNRKLQLQLGQKLAEAALVLADNDGRADPKTRNKAREKYVLEALKVVKKLVQAGYPDAMFYLADCYGTGRLGLEPDAKEAFALYQTAAKAGHAPSAYRTAVCWEMGPDGGGGTRREPQKAIQWYKRAAGLGDTPAMYKLGMIQLKGLLGQARNAGEAVAWLRRAAERADAENPHALHELALLYESGLDDIAPNEAHSIALFTRAAELGYKFSQFRLGSAHEYGLMGCAIDARRSIGWYSRAAAQAEHQSELALSGWYLTGADPVLHQSDTEAYLWARRAAHAGLPKAEYAMGYFTEVGIGAPPNVEEAKRWYRKAAAQNFPNARERLHDFQKGGATVQSRERISRSKVGKQHEGECCVM